MASAFIGDLPANDDDTAIIKGVLRLYGLNSVNASAGYQYAIKRPANPPVESKQVGIVVGMAIVILAILVPTISRIWIRLGKRSQEFGLDDWTIMVAAAVAVVYPCLVIAMVFEAGAGRHSYENTYAEWQRLFYYLSMCKIIFYVAVGLIKVSITLFLRRLTDRASKAWRICADVFLVTLVAYEIVVITWFFMQCNPIRVAWDMHYSGSLATPATCSNSGLMNKFFSGMHVAQGAVLLLSPIAFLWKVRIDTGKKFRLFFMWIVGGLTITGGLLQQFGVVITNDTSWQFTTVIRWTTLDLALGTLVASLPVLDSAIMGTWSDMKTAIGINTGSGRSRGMSGRHGGGGSSGGGGGGLSGSGTNVLESRHRGPKNTKGWTDLESQTAVSVRMNGSFKASRGANSDSDSFEEIIPKGSKEDRKGGVQLNIMRVDEVRLSWEDDSAAGLAQGHPQQESRGSDQSGRHQQFPGYRR